jgi:AcrR family transcriptional regulator
MRQTKTDRRSLRTRRLLMQAMVELMRVKRYDAITVQEITEQANVGRSTFYAHFTDKDDLLVDGVHRMLASLEVTTAEHPAGGTARPYPTLALFRHIGEQADLYQVLSRGRGLTLFLAALHDELTTVFTERLTAGMTPGETPAVPPPLLAAMVVSMLITAIRTWVEQGATAPAETVDRMFHIAAQPALRAGLRPPRE